MNNGGNVPDGGLIHGGITSQWNARNYPPGHRLSNWAASASLGVCPFWEKIRDAALLVCEDPEMLLLKDEYCGEYRQMMAHNEGPQGPICACIDIAKKLQMKFDIATRADRAPIVINSDGAIRVVIECQATELDSEFNELEWRVAGTRVLSQWQRFMAKNGNKRATLHSAYLNAKKVLRALTEGPLGAKGAPDWNALDMSGLPEKGGCEQAPRYR